MQNTKVVTDATRAIKNDDSTGPLDKTKVLGSCGVPDLVEDPSKFGDNSGGVDHVERKATAAVVSHG